MGIYNSSEHRVKPLMEVLEKDESKFHDFLNLMDISVSGKPEEFCYSGDNSKEKALKPTKRHLKELVCHLSKNGKGKFKSDNEKRQKLFAGDEKTKENALKEIEENYEQLPSRAWYIFEGNSYPDIYIEGDDYIIIGEGKWTEPKITEGTTYLKENRNQMIRHIQGALNSENKTVYAFYIVDEVYGADYLDELEKSVFEEKVKKETIKLQPEEAKKIISAYKGYLTWQIIERELGIKFQTKDDVFKSHMSVSPKKSFRAKP